MPVFAKDPGSTVDYALEWVDWLAAGEVISVATWEASPAEAGGLAINEEIAEGSRRGCLVAGGVAGHSYRLTCRITTDQGRVCERSLTIRCQER